MRDLPKNLIAIHSAPRSGSSWLGQIFKSSPHVEFRYQPLFSYAFKDYLDPLSSRGRILEFAEAIYQSQDAYIHQRIEDVYVEYPDLGPRKEVTHLVWKEVRYHHLLRNMMEQVPEIKVVGLVRHPCAVVDSWLHSPREFKQGWDVSKEWRDAPSKNLDKPEEYNGFSKWMELTRLFLDLERLYPKRFLMVHYPLMNRDPEKVARNIFGFCNLPLSDATLRFIRESRSKEGSDANSIYRLPKQDTRWEERLPASISGTIIREATEAGLERFLI